MTKINSNVSQQLCNNSATSRYAMLVDILVLFLGGGISKPNRDVRLVFILIRDLVSLLYS